MRSQSSSSKVAGLAELPDNFRSKGYCPPGSVMSSFGKRLKRWRILRGYSQEQLAEASDTTVRQVRNLEKSVHLPQPATAERLADSLGIQVLDLWDDL